MNKTGDLGFRSTEMDLQYNSFTSSDVNVIRVKQLSNIILFQSLDLEITSTTYRPKYLKLENYFILNTPNEVYDFLGKNLFLARFLFDSIGKVSSHFDNSIMKLRVRNDPEFNDKKLIVDIKTNYPPLEAIDRLNKFDEDWGYNTQKQTSGLIIFTLNFE